MGRKKDKRKAEARAESARPLRSLAERAAEPARPARLTRMVPVRFEPTMLDEVQRRAHEDGRSVSAWIRRAVESELRRDATA